eukprot:scaffold3180_cov399-Prasinococcus_capsulatus_cf.AAC.5
MRSLGDSLCRARAHTRITCEQHQSIILMLMWMMWVRLLPHIARRRAPAGHAAEPRARATSQAERHKLLR